MLLATSCTILGVAFTAVRSCGNDSARPGQRWLPRGFERSSSMRAPEALRMRTQQTGAKSGATLGGRAPRGQTACPRHAVCPLGVRPPKSDPDLAGREST